MCLEVKIRITNIAYPGFIWSSECIWGVAKWVLEEVYVAAGLKYVLNVLEWQFFNHSMCMQDAWPSSLQLMPCRLALQEISDCWAHPLLGKVRNDLTLQWVWHRYFAELTLKLQGPRYFSEVLWSTLSSSFPEMHPASPAINKPLPWSSKSSPASYRNRDADLHNIMFYWVGNIFEGLECDSLCWIYRQQLRKIVNKCLVVIYRGLKDD